jgi:pyridoxamine 5'-phosphate oxidase
MSRWKTIADIRREYGNLSLNEENVLASPIAQFEEWFAEVLQTEKSDPTAMVLSTVDECGYPDARVVLLKGLEDQAFVFYTNYQSSKALHLNKVPYAALTFYWPQTARQVRIRGKVEKISAEQSDAYFSSRPTLSQLSAISSPQSKIVAGRVILDEQLKNLTQQYQNKPISRPEYWGGYKLLPTEFEFWQGRDNRLHDRLQYLLKQGQWKIQRLAP